MVKKSPHENSRQPGLEKLKEGLQKDYFSDTYTKLGNLLSHQLGYVKNCTDKPCREYWRYRKTQSTVQEKQCKF